jgi:hypothetical protein
MKKNTMLHELTQLFISISADDARKYIAAVVMLTLTGLCASLYYVNTKSSQHVRSITQARALSTKTDELISAYNAVIQEEDNLAALLAKKTDYNSLKSYFERFCQANKVTPETGWAETNEVREIAGSTRFEEEQLHAQFKKIAFKDIVLCVDAIEKDDLLHLKELDIEKSDGTLSVKMTLAAKRFKRTIEE